MFQYISLGLLVLMLAVFVVLLPLTSRAIVSGFLDPFNTLRASLALIEGFLVVTVAVLCVEYKLLGDKYSDLA